MQSLPEILAHHNIPTDFTREHDVILLAWPFNAVGPPTALSPAHLERFQDALLRGFIRSACAVASGELSTALEQSCTLTLTYRLMPGLHQATHAESLLLTCASNAHLALTNLLERHAVFTVEIIGRVIFCNDSCQAAKPGSV